MTSLKSVFSHTKRLCFNGDWILLCSSSQTSSYYPVLLEIFGGHFLGERSSGDPSVDGGLLLIVMSSCVDRRDEERLNGEQAQRCGDCTTSKKTYLNTFSIFVCILHSLWCYVVWHIAPPQLCSCNRTSTLSVYLYYLFTSWKCIRLMRPRRPFWVLQYKDPELQSLLKSVVRIPLTSPFLLLLLLLL